MLSFLGAWAKRQLARETFWPAVGVIVTVIWLFRGPGGIPEFTVWGTVFGGLVALLTGGTMLTKRLKNGKGSGPGPVDYMDGAVDSVEEPPPK